MIRDIRSYKRKKYQHAVNRYVRKFNKDIKADWLWNARFTLRQKESYFLPFNDHSGAEFIVVLELTDNKTGRAEVKQFNNYNIEWKLYEWANICITNVWKVWQESPDPNEQARLAGRILPEVY
jgi:hypothetical protein